MSIQRMANEALNWYLGELTCRIVAQSGIVTDRYHIGKMILQSLRDDPDFLVDIDGATNESETASSLLERTCRCATSFKNMGLKCGDVIIIMAPNHIDINIPLYAALYLGITIAAVDKSLTIKELERTFEISEPKIIFCQSDRAPDVQVSLNNLNLDSQIVTFDKGDYLCSFQEFMENFRDDISYEDFVPADFDPEDTDAFHIYTSGTTGLPKAAALTHKNLTTSTPYFWNRHTQFPGPTRMIVVCSPLQWLTAIMNFVMSPILRYTRLQTSANMTQEHAYYLINTFKPTFAIFSPTMLTAMLKAGEREKCDFTCFETILLGGSAVPQVLIDEFKTVSPNTEIINVYGMSELSGVAFCPDSPAPGSCGKPIGCFQHRLVDVEKNEDIDEAYVPGELWVKGPGIFKGYYKNEAATDETFAEDRWFKTGDMFYRDENWNYFFVERIKLLLKYKSYQISPVEVEGVIRQHPGVLDVAVTGIPDPDCGELCVACVVRHPDSEVTAQEIKDLVKDNLSDSKQLRGGVIFVNAIPVTATTKVHRRKIKEIALELPRE